jgi:hypothetical protein
MSRYTHIYEGILTSRVALTMGSSIQTLILLKGIHAYQIPLPLVAVEEAQQSHQPLHLAFRSAAPRLKDLTPGRSQDSCVLAFALTRLSYAPPGRNMLKDASVFTRGVDEVESPGGELDLRGFFRSGTHCFGE